jgi:transcriptional repressor NrdR
MVCLYCGSETSVTNSRWQKRNNQIWRRRQCKACRAIFTTHEAIDLSNTLMVDSRGSAGPFLADMLFSDLLEAMQDRSDRYTAAREAAATTIKHLVALPNKPVYRPDQITAAAGAVLSRLDRRAWLRYVAEHPSLQR